MKRIWAREAALLLAAVQASLAVVVSFGLQLTPEQVGSIMALAAALVALITRQQTKPGRRAG